MTVCYKIHILSLASSFLPSFLSLRLFFNTIGFLVPTNFRRMCWKDFWWWHPFAYLIKIASIIVYCSLSEASSGPCKGYITQQNFWTPSHNHIPKLPAFNKIANITCKIACEIACEIAFTFTDSISIACNKSSNWSSKFLLRLYYSYWLLYNCCMIVFRYLRDFLFVHLDSFKRANWTMSPRALQKAFETIWTTGCNWKVWRYT